MSDSASFGAISTHVHVRTAVRSSTNSTVIDLGGGEVLLIDPAVEASDLKEIASWLSETERSVAVGWSTHAHWDHVLWSSELGPEVKRYATAENAATCAAEIEELGPFIEASARGHELELCGVLTALDESSEDWPDSCQVFEHRAHAPGHAALLFERDGILVAGDMVSDIEIPSLDLDRDDPIGDYEAALVLLEELAGETSLFVPGHGAVGDSAELRRRISLDRRYLEELRDRRQISDTRPRAAWLERQHESQVRWCLEHRSATGDALS